MPTILYVEDDRLTRESITGRLARRGLAVLQAQSGEEALQLAAARSDLSVALLDVELPGIDGAETLRRLRQLHPRLPVVVCSAHMQLGIREKLLAMGIPAECLLAKPCRFHHLLETVTVAMRKPGTDGHHDGGPSPQTG